MRCTHLKVYNSLIFTNACTQVIHTPMKMAIIPPIAPENYFGLLFSKVPAPVLPLKGTLC